MRKTLLVIAVGIELSCGPSPSVQVDVFDSSAVLRNRNSTVTIRFPNPLIDAWVCPGGEAFAGATTEENAANGLPVSTMLYTGTARDGYRVRSVRLPREFLQSLRAPVVRQPSISPDGSHVFFVDEFTMTTKRLYAVHTESHVVRELASVVTYCVLWGGKQNGALAIQQRRIDPSPSTGVQHWCSVVSDQGTELTRAEPCESWREFIGQVQKHSGGVCTGAVEINSGEAVRLVPGGK